MTRGQRGPAVVPYGDLRRARIATHAIGMTLKRRMVPSETDRIGIARGLLALQKSGILQVWIDGWQVRIIDPAVPDIKRSISWARAAQIVDRGGFD